MGKNGHYCCKYRYRPGYTQSDSHSRSLITHMVFERQRSKHQIITTYMPSAGTECNNPVLHSQRKTWRSAASRDKTTVNKRRKNGILPRLQINKQREMIALDRQGTQQQRPESPRVTPPGVRVNTWYVNSTKGTCSQKDAPSGMHTLHFRHTRRHRCVQVYERTDFYSRYCYIRFFIQQIPRWQFWRAVDLC